MKLTAMKNGLLCLSLLLAPGVSAKVLTVTLGSGAKTQVELSKISRIHFNSGTMNIEHADGTHQIALGDIEHIRFDLVATSLDDITKSLDELMISFAAGKVSANADADTAIKLDVYDLKGYKVAAAGGVGSVSLDLSGLASGMYIVKANDKTIKFIR